MKELLEILSGLHPEIDFERHRTLIDDSILDSFDIISIIAEIVEVYDVQIPADEIVPENFNSAEALFNLILRLDD